MSNNFDFINKGSVIPNNNAPKITVYGPQGAVPINPPRFPTAYLTAPPYDTNNNITPTNGPNITVYNSLDTPKFPFTYIGTDAISNIGLFGEVTPNNGPKISVHLSAYIGTLVYSFDLNTTPSTITAAQIPLITNSVFIIRNISQTTTVTGSVTTITVTVSVSYIDDGSNFGLSFKNCFTFYNTNTSNLTITTLTNIPLSRLGEQFSGLTNALNSTNNPSLFASGNVIPQILPNTSLFRCFASSTNFNSDISGWDTTNVTSMQAIFTSTTKFSQPIGNWNTSNVTTMENMFYNTSSSFNQPIGNWDTSKVISMANMFRASSSFNQPIGNWNTSKVTTMANMFLNATSFNQYIYDWNLSGILSNNYYTLTGKLEYSFTATKSISFSASNIPLITNANFTFSFTTAPLLTSGNLTVNTSYKVTCTITYKPNPTDNSDFGLSFKSCVAFYNTNTSNLSITTLTNIPLSKIGEQFSGLTNVINLFSSSIVIPIILPNTSLSNCFNGCTTFNQDISSWNTTNVTNMSSMFFKCTNFNQNISSWITTNVTNMSSMFSGGWPNPTAMNFNGDISSWNTENVTDMTQMFTNCQSFNKQVGNWKTSNVTTMNLMFTQCINFNNEDTGDNKAKPFSNNWVTSKVTSMNGMFFSCSNFNQNISNWDTRMVTVIDNIFYGAGKFKNADAKMTNATNTTWYFNNIPSTGTNAKDWHGNGCPLVQTNAPIQLQSNTFF